MRCFAAVDLPAGLGHKVARLQQEIKNCGVKLVEKENLHYTLKFFGEVDDRQLTAIKEKLAAVAKGFAPMAVHVKGAGAFPSEKFVRVVWVGGAELLNLQQDVIDAFPDFGKEKASPHLTIARVRSPEYKEQLATFLSKNRDVDIGSFTATNIILKKSTVKRTGPVYENVAIFDLKDRNEGEK